MARQPTIKAKAETKNPEPEEVVDLGLESGFHVVFVLLHGGEESEAKLRPQYQKPSHEA